MEIFKKIYAPLLIICILLISCSKTTVEQDSYASYKDYYKINVGDAYLYRLDSTVLLSFGTDTVTNTYYQKDSVISLSLDGESRPTYRVYTYVKPFTSTTNNWVYTTAYNITYDTTNLQLVDANNLRFIKLSSPVTADHSWDGNAYFTTGAAVTGSYDTPQSVYVNQQDFWLYKYDSLNSNQTYYGQAFNNALTVNEIDYTLGTMTSYYLRLYSSESYAKGLGLIHRKFLFLNWQPTSGYSSYSYGIELTRMN